MIDPRITDLEDVKKVFDSYGVRLILVYGALLGFFRDGKFLPDDDDIDLAVVDKISFKTRKDIGYTLLDLGFKTQGIAFNVVGRLEEVQDGYNGDDQTGIIVCERNTKFTIFFFKEEDCDLHGKEYVCMPKYHSIRLISTPIKFFQKLGKIKIKGKEYLTPWPVHDYLADTYFNNWKDKNDRRHGLLYDAQHPNSKRYENM